MARRPVGTGWRTAPGPGDLPARTSDPQTDTPGGCQECDGRHPTNHCPHLVRATTQENR
jgi:hypothetical protein